MSSPSSTCCPAVAPRPWPAEGRSPSPSRSSGYDLDDYDELYAEKLELLLAIRAGNPVNWSGSHRPSLHNAQIHPRPVQDPLPVWVAVGGTPRSVVRAAALELPLTLAIIGGQPARF